MLSGGAAKARGLVISSCAGVIRQLTDTLWLCYHLVPAALLVDAGPRCPGTIPDDTLAAGDVIDPTYRQAVTAAGSGTVAALDAEHFLASLGDAGEPAADADQLVEA